MAIEVRLPELGESVTQARLISWLKNEGERVSRGEVIAEVETDKTNVEIEAPGDGVLTKIHVAAGTDKVPINELLASLDAGGSDAVSEPADTAARPVVAPAGDQKPQRANGSDAVAVGPTPPASAAAVKVEHAEPVAPETSFRADRDVAASPLARRMAYAAGISLATIRGTGSGGRITKEDVEKAIRPAVQPQPAASRTAISAPPSVSLPQGDVDRYELSTLSTMRRVTGERLTYAKQTIPHFYLHIECAMDAVSRMRQELNARVEGEKLSFTAFTLRAAALALKKVPAANAMWADGAVRLYRHADLAVAVNTPSGLIAPIVRSADEKSVLQINEEIRTLAERARAGRLKPEDYSGGTCTVSNLGMYGITSLYPIVNPPQTCILGVGAIEERPIVRNHAVAVGLMMTATLSADHRALDGATGAEFLAAFRNLLEDPWSLIL